MLTSIGILVAAGIVGSRILYLIQHDPGALVSPADWFSGRGFSFYGALIVAPFAVAIYLRRSGAGLRYLDALAAGFPIGMAVGRIGDLISGEHYGPPTDLPWGVRYTHAQAEVPELGVAYHAGGLYEILLGLALAAVLMPLWRRLAAPASLFWATILGYATGRFLMFFFRDDSGTSLGLRGAQWMSLALIGLSGAGLWMALRQSDGSRARNGRPRQEPG